MGLYVSTTGTSVDIPELGISITHPTTDRDLSYQFSAEDIRGAATLTATIRAGTLTWKKMLGGSVQPATDYDPDFVKIDGENSGLGIKGDREPIFSDLSSTGVLGSPFIASLAIVSTAASTSKVTLSGTYAGEHICPGDTFVILTGAAAGTYTIGQVPSSTEIIVVEPILDGTTASADVYHPSGAKLIGFNNTGTMLLSTDAEAAIIEADFHTAIRSATVANTSFTGDPKKYAITFTRQYINNQYTISFSGLDVRMWTWENKTRYGFTINSNANQALSMTMTWTAILVVTP